MKEFISIVITGRRNAGPNETKKIIAEIQKQSRLVTNSTVKLNSKIERTQTYYILKAMGVIKL